MRSLRLNVLGLFLISSLLLFACKQRGPNNGVITLVNSSNNDAIARLDDERVTIKAGTLATNKGQKAGEHTLIIGEGDAAETHKINVIKDRTTLFDINPDNCYIVADFTEQYKKSGSGEVKIVERFEKQQAFTTSNKMTADLGEPLTDKITEGERAYRIHRVHCDILNNDPAIVESLSNEP